LTHHRTRPQSARPNLEALEGRRLPSGTSAAAGHLQAAYGQVPLSFEANQGQTDPQVNFLARGTGYALFLTDTAAVISLRTPSAPSSTDTAAPNATVTGTVLRLSLVGAQAAAPVAGEEPLAATSNYFIGSDPHRWRSGVATFGRVAYTGVYPGIDLTYYGNQQQLEYDFTVTPGMDPSVIHLKVEGAQGLSLDGQGDLLLSTAGGNVVEHAPVLYQEVGGGRQGVTGGFVLEGGDQVGFAVGAYDRSRPLVIDPTLSYSTYLGGSNLDQGNGIAVDAAGNAYVTGSAGSSNFPTTPGAFQTTLRSFQNAFVTKLNASGTALVYSTYLGGSGHDSGAGIALDAAGNAYVTGSTDSSNFPTTSGAFQTTLGSFFGNAFVTKLNAAGTALVYSTYLGGSGFFGDEGRGIAVDAAGNAYVTGQTSSTNFPTTPGAFQATLRSINGNAFVTKLNASGTALVYSTYLGGSFNDHGTGIALDSAGDAYVTGGTQSRDFPTTPGAFQTTLGGFGGPNAFVTKLNAAGTALVYSTYLGGSFLDQGFGVAVDAAGNAFVTGSAGSSNFPTTPGAFQTTLRGSVTNAFVTKLNASGTALVYSTYLGGSYRDEGNGIALDAAGNAYVTGGAGSRDFPTTPGAFQTTFLGGSFGQNAFVTKLNASGTALVYSTYLGGSGAGSFDGDSGAGIALDAAGNAYVAGFTYSSDFPTTPGAFQTRLRGFVNAFVAKFYLAQPVRFFAIGGAPGRVLVYKPDNTLVADFQPYGPAYTGPISVALGDITGNGYYDLVTAAAAGNPDVRVYDGRAFATGTFDPNNPGASLLTQWFAYGLNFNIGANVAVGDIETDGFADIVTGASAGNPDVRVFRGRDIATGSFEPTGTSLVAQFFPYALGFNIGVNVAVGDVSGNGFADLVTAPTAGNPDVRVFRGQDIAQGTFQPTGHSLLAQFFPYALGFNVGAFVAVGDTTGSGFGDVITGASAGNPDVRVYSGQAIAQGSFNGNNPDASLRSEFFAYELGLGLGATVASADFAGTGRYDILTGASFGAPHYRVVAGTSTGVLPPALFEGIPSDLQDGIAVGA
jgi:hypothetical protein